MSIWPVGSPLSPSAGRLPNQAPARRPGCARAAPEDASRTVRFAILGTRGIPARYGGFETFAEELSTRLAERGHEITVYCRERPPEPCWRGVHLRYLSP